MEPISANLATVSGRIEAAARAAGRPADAVTLIGASRTQPADSVRAALAAGQRVFGENRVQEAVAKFPGLRRDYPDLTLHLIGPLHTNKVKDAIAHCDVIETVDRPRLAEALAREMERSGRRLPCFIADCRGRLALPVIGVMCIPPEHEEPALHFALLREIAKRNGLDQLSMGMSADFETAIRFGATYVRVGTAIFGARRIPAGAAAAAK